MTAASHESECLAVISADILVACSVSGGKQDVSGISPQEFSSLPSVQSSSPSHCHTEGMQRPFPHWNWLASHSVFVPAERKKEGRVDYRLLCRLNGICFFV